MAVLDTPSSSSSCRAARRPPLGRRRRRAAPVNFSVARRCQCVPLRYREAARTCEGQLGDETAAVREALQAFTDLGQALIGARDTGEALDAVITNGPGWEGLGDLVARAAALANAVASDPLNHVLGGYSRFRRYTPRMLRMLDIEASPVAKPLLEAVDVLHSDATVRPTGSAR